MKIQIKKYEVKDETLKNIVCFYWQIESEEEALIDHTLLPVINTDLILNFAAPIEYRVNGEKLAPSDFHFSAIKDRNYTICQKGKINVLGISFLPHGLYHLLQKPMSTFSGKIVDIKDQNLEISKIIRVKDFCNLPTEEKISEIEKALRQDLAFTIDNSKALKRINDFYPICNEIKISDFCLTHQISTKQFERIFLKIVGIKPKQFQRLNRYQKSIPTIIHEENKDNLCDLANDLNYYDQTHFNKEFLQYSGSSPTEFKKMKRTIKQNSEIV